jgi:hypothetical protein
MEDFLNSETATMIATFLAGVIATGLAWGSTALIKSFKASSNKVDDAFIPLLETLNNAIDGLKNSTPIEKK